MSDANYQVTWKDLDRGLFQVSPVRGIIDLVVVWAGIFAVAGLGYRFIFPFSIAAMILIGVLQNGLSSLGHHAMHIHLHPNPRWNDSIFRWLIAAPLGQSYLSLRREHFEHHARFAEPDDPERFYYDLDVGDRSTPFRLLFWMVRMFLGFVVVGQLQRLISGSRGGHVATRTTPELMERAARERREYLYVVPAQVIIFLMMYGVTGSPLGYFLFWVIPLITVGAGLTAIRATIEHADASRAGKHYVTFTSNVVERFIVGPFNFNYHYEHHRFMGVPYYRIGKVRQVLKAAADYADCTIENSYGHRCLKVFIELHRRVKST